MNHQINMRNKSLRN